MSFGTFIKQVEVNSGGGIRISVYKQSFGPNGELIAEQPHQIMIGPFADFDFIIAQNNEHLQQMGYPPIDPVELTLPLQLRATAHDHSAVKERMVIEAKIVAEKKAADEEATKQAEKERQAAIDAQTAQFDEAVKQAVERHLSTTGPVPKER